MPVLESSSDQKYYHQLPTVSFRIIDDETSRHGPAGVHSEQSRSYGYNDFSEFERPEYYIRYIEPIESELRAQVEYDMDEQDEAWLDALNAERKKDQSGPISYEVFEIVMDNLEKEWFELIKRIPQPASHMPVEDSKCAVCDDPEGENSNAIVFCDGCNLAVHQDCYGVPYIPEGQWLCRKCTVSPENPVSCLFCPNEGGAFKQTTTGHWAHLLCAIWIPEVTVGNAIYMEPVDGAEMVPKSRWKLLCSLCREKGGACIQCDNKNCFTAFHVTCARSMGLLMSMKSMSTDGQLRAFCEKHIPAGSAMDDDEYDEDEVSNFSGSPVAPPPRKRSQSRGQRKISKSGPVTTKSARAHAKSYRPGPPIVPNVILQSLLNYVGKISIRKKHGFIERLCRYWSLKREARRGAPLLKRLHLEPWTASSSAKQQTDAEKALKLKFLTKLRNDLEKVRMLAELVRKREKEKLRQSQIISDVVDQFIFPYYGRLRLTLEKISAMDRQELFLHPVNKLEVPDYLDVIKKPMCWLDIDDKIEKNRYTDVNEFQHDIHLVLDNAMTYNAAETPFHRIAKRIKSSATPLLEQLDAIPAMSALSMSNEVGKAPNDPEAGGDLEPSPLLLQTLITRREDGEASPLESIFRFEMEPVRPPSPSPPPPKERKVLTAAERRQRWEERQAAAKDRIGSGNTRSSAAMTKAFEKEAGVNGSGSSSAQQSAEASSSASRRGARRNDVAQSSEPVRIGTGIAGYETYAVLSDRQRREQERKLELMTEKVDNQDIFKRFNVGWVLPEGSKRRRSERPPEPPKQSKARSSKAAIKAEDIPLDDDISDGSASSLTPPPASTSLSSTPTISRTTRSGPTRTAKVNDDDDSTPRGNKRKRRESHLDSLSPKKRRMSSRKGKSTENSEEKDAEDADQNIDDEMEVDDEVEEKVAKPTSRSRPRRSTAAKTAMLPVKAVVDDGEDPYPAHTLVWAKLTSFPWFPADIVDLTHDDPSEIPPSVLANREQAERENRSKGERTWLVRFFDKQNSYGWIPASKLELLGEDNAVDEMYLAGRDRTGVKRFRTPHLRTACRKAYRDAMAQMAVEGEEEEEE